jgi:hypothetical protein
MTTPKFLTDSRFYTLLVAFALLFAGTYAPEVQNICGAIAGLLLASVGVTTIDKTAVTIGEAMKK